MIASSSKAWKEENAKNQLNNHFLLNILKVGTIGRHKKISSNKSVILCNQDWEKRQQQWDALQNSSDAIMEIASKMSTGFFILVIIASKISTGF